MAVLDSYTYICSIFEYTLYIDPILHPYGSQATPIFSMLHAKIGRGDWGRG